MKARMNNKEIHKKLRELRFISNGFVAYQKARPLLAYLAEKILPNGDDLITPEHFGEWENSEVLDDTVILARLTFSPTPPYVGSVEFRTGGRLTLNGTPLSSVQNLQQFSDLMHLLGVKRKESSADCKTDPEIGPLPPPSVANSQAPGC